LDLVRVAPFEGARRVSYVSCHDNHTLWDKLSITTKDEATRLKEYKLAAAIYMLMPGKVFFLSGEEFCRSKMGEENSYNLPLSVNAINWENVDTYGDMISYYKKLIAFRKSLSCLNRTEGESPVTKTYFRGGVIGYRVKDGDKEYQVFFNGRESEHWVLFFGGDWKVLFSSEDVKDFSSKVLLPKSVLVLERKGN
jgi:pullulanase